MKGMLSMGPTPSSFNHNTIMKATAKLSIDEWVFLSNYEKQYQISWLPIILSFITE